MSSYNSRLFNEPKLRRIVEVGDDISEQTALLADALAIYGDAETTEDREDARQEAWSIMGALISYLEDMRALRETLEA